MTEKLVALITGANKGLGREAARQLARRGMTVVATARDRARGEASAAALRDEKLDVRALALDVTDGASIAAAARWVEGALGRLDLLVNNAGIVVSDGKPSEMDLADVRKTYETNLFGVVAVTQAFLPLLRRAPAGRIVNVSSGLGSLARMSNPTAQFARFSSVGYAASKTALNAVTVAFANELRETPIKVNAADPGWCATDLNNHTGPRSVEEGVRVVVQLATLGADGPTGGFFDENGPEPW